MAFTYYNLQPFARGDDWTIEYVITDENNTPVDITGNLYWMTLKEKQDDPDPGIAQVYSTASGPDALNGIVFLSLDAAVTYNFTPGNYFYDLQEVDTSGNVYTLLLGKVKVVKDITRSITP